LHSLYALYLRLRNDGMQGGVTSLSYAAFNGHLSVVKYLIKMGADLNLANNVSACLILLIAKGCAQIHLLFRMASRP